MQKLLEKAARRAERAAVMDTCPREEGDQDMGRTECVGITPTWPIHVGAWHLWVGKEQSSWIPYNNKIYINYSCMAKYKMIHK